jgi:hypothetical protein
MSIPTHIQEEKKQQKLEQIAERVYLSFSHIIAEASRDYNIKDMYAKITNYCQRGK